ncbi:MAG: response regulator [Pseudomonadota bacterium]
MPTNKEKKTLVLIVDDDFLHRLPMRAALESCGYQVEEAKNGVVALEKYQLLHPDMVILDVLMPELDGFDTCTQLRNMTKGQYLPILMITSMDDLYSIDKAYEAGATDFLTKPVNWALLGHKISYLLRSSKTAQSLAVSKSKLLASELEVIQRLGIASDYKDNETGNHIKRMSRFSEIIAKAAGLDEKECQLIRQASPMHDVGKIGIADNIILKPGKLTTQEFNLIKTHTSIGAEILAGNLSTLIQTAYIIALTHHEKWDGSGYPMALCGEEIPLFGRICAIADVFDALTSNRPYKEAWDIDRAVNKIKSLAGSHFDPFLVDKFMKIIPQIIIIKESFNDS